MSDLILRDLDDGTMVRLKACAAGQKKTIEQVARDVLMDAVRAPNEDVWTEIDRIRALSKPSDVDSVTLVREARDGNDSGH